MDEKKNEWKVAYRSKNVLEIDVTSWSDIFLPSKNVTLAINR